MVFPFYEIQNPGSSSSKWEVIFNHFSIFFSDRINRINRIFSEITLRPFDLAQGGEPVEPQAQDRLVRIITKA